MARSVRNNFIWNLAGVFAYNLSQWLLLVALARLGDAEAVGTYSYALALTAPIFLTLGLNLRVVRATDARRRWSRRQYLRLRIALNVVSFLVTLCIGVLTGLRGLSLLLLLIVAIAKSIENTSLLTYGFFQQRDRLDLVSRSLMARAVLGSVAFVTAFAASRQLAVAAGGLAVGWWIVWALHDRPAERALQETETEFLSNEALPGSPPSTSARLASTALPLGLDTGAVSLTSNVPRIAVQHSVGSAELGVFAALAYLGNIVSMITGSLGDAVVSPLARASALADRRLFFRLSSQLVIVALFVGAVVAVAAYIIGPPLVALLLGPEYADRALLVVLMLGAGGITLQRSLARGLQAMHRFGLLLCLDLLMLLFTIALVLLWVPDHGALGAATALALASSGGALLTFVGCWGALRSIDLRKGDK